MKLLTSYILLAASTLLGAGNFLKDKDLCSPSQWHIFGKKQKCTLKSVDDSDRGKVLELKASKDYSGIMTSIKVSDKGPFELVVYVKITSPGISGGRFSLICLKASGSSKKSKLLNIKIPVEPELAGKWIKTTLIIPGSKTPFDTIYVRLVPPQESVVRLDGFVMTEADSDKVKKGNKPAYDVIVKPEKTGSLKIAKLGQKHQLDILRPKVDMFTQYGNGKFTLEHAPEEVMGYPFVKTYSPYKTFVFTVNEPVRSYWLGYTMHKSSIPANWKMARQNAVEIANFNSSQKIVRQNIYYVDLQPGQTRMTGYPNRFVNLAVKPFSVMTAKDCVMNVYPTTGNKVYTPGQPVKLQLVADNPTGKKIKADIKWRIAGKKIGGSKDIVIESRQELKDVITLPAMGEGFYQFIAELMIDGKLIDKRIFPIAVIPNGVKFTSKGPRFPFGVYNKFFVTEDTLIMEVYYRWICNLLVSNNMNLLVGPALDNFNMESKIADEYGIKLILRTNFRQSVPESDTIIAYMYGDEPKTHQIPKYRSAYDKYQKQLGKPLITCLLAGSTGQDDPRDPLKLWKLLDPKLRFCRLYPYRKNEFGLVNWAKQKYKFSPAEIFEKIEKASPEPWWYILQIFGKPAKPGKEPYWRNPSANELVALSHLALANGARGIIGWAFQCHGNNLTCVVDQYTLKPIDGKLSGLKRIGAILKDHSALLLRHKRGDFPVNSDSAEVVAVPRVDPDSNLKYVYAVNQDPVKSVNVKLTVPDAGTAIDIYSGMTYKVIDGTLSLKMAPAQGMFLELK